MREIKFRYWSDLDDRWFYNTIQEIQTGTWHGLIDVEWQQFTGLKDKNGTDIYEGDILKDSYGTKVLVRWSEDVCEEYNCVGWTLNRGYGDTGEDNEVIGNIYENPTLLTQENDKPSASEPRVNDTENEVKSK